MVNTILKVSYLFKKLCKLTTTKHVIEKCHHKIVTLMYPIQKQLCMS